ncbi:pachytene checkpoint protein 2 homolog [Schistocerca nitens]|uniref:pachytene checkpoint protein 2 homolog n=1 Tax=Schistocerca nitens TaxID=7011 RepID=UPI002118360A|nr:pachytene checkpoint protein 2 homolog [Schistocerca nitens]
MKRIVHIEINQRLESNAPRDVVIEFVSKFAKSCKLIQGSIINSFDDPFLCEHVQTVKICEINDEAPQCLEANDVDLCYHVYTLDPYGSQLETMDGEGDKEVPFALHCILPTTEFAGVWESLVYDSAIKENLLNFVETTLLFSDSGVDMNIIKWNRVVLLHGPPGTGKTSLCKALAQKLAIRLGHRYTHGEFIEINSHSLFSKWFSESGKLVTKMFSKIQEYIENPNALVCVLIDEVESLTHARKSALAGTEPSDSIRVVNAVLTQIDQIQRYRNVLVLATSNVTGAIDTAFVDRADIKQYIGPPSPFAIYKIFLSCIEELQRTGIITSNDSLMNLKLLQLSSSESTEGTKNNLTKNSLFLLNIARKSEGLSGRSLRKIPFLAHSYYIQKQTTSLEEFLEAMEKTVLKQLQDQKFSFGGVPHKNNGCNCVG